MHHFQLDQVFFWHLRAGRWALCSERIHGRLVSRQPLHHHGTPDQARRGDGAGMAALDVFFPGVSFHSCAHPGFLDMAQQGGIYAQ
jgi:hypothetical protein